MTAADLWPLGVLLGVTLAAGVAAGVLANALLALRDLTRADRQAAATRREQR